MSTCQLCGAQVEWHENLHVFVNPITGAKHGYNLCLIKIPRYEMSAAGVLCVRRADAIAADIVKRCLDAGKDIDRIRPTIEGDFVIIK